MRRHRSASHKVAKPAARRFKSPTLRARAIGLAAVAAALELPIEAFDPKLAALIERGAMAIAPTPSQLAA